MANSIRQNIVEQILARFATITKANGYTSDLGKQMFEWRDADFTLDELAAGACGNLMDTDEKHTNLVSGGMGLGIQDHELTMELYVVLSDADKTPKTARGIMADVIKAIGVDVKWNGNAIDTLPGETKLDVVQDKKKIGAFKKIFTVKYRSRRFDAYTKP